MSRGKYLIKNTLFFALGNLGTKLISFFLVPLYTIILTSEEYGTIDLIFTICMFVAPIIILNIHESIMRFCLDKDADYSKIMSIGIIMFMISCIIGILCAIFAKLYKPTEEYYLYVYFYTISIGFSQIFLCYLRGKEYLFQYSLGNILQSLLIASLNIWFLFGMNLGIRGYLLAYIIANMLTGIYAFIVGKVGSTIKRFSVDKKLATAMVKYSIVLVPNSFMWWILNSLDRVMLSSLIGISSTGIYAVANKIPSLISVVSTIFNQAFSYSAIRENDNEDKEVFSNSVFGFLFPITSIMGMILIIIIRPFMRIYVSNEFFQACLYAPALITGTCILVLATFLSTAYTVNKDSKGFLYSSTVGAVLNISMNFLLIPSLGIMGASVATAISYFVVFVYRSVDTQKYIKITIFTFKHIISLVTLVLMCIFSYLNFQFGNWIMILLLVINFLLYKKQWKQILLLIKRLKKSNIK